MTASRKRFPVNRRSRRGTLYLQVVVVTAIVSMMALCAMHLVRLERRHAESRQDVEEAKLLARSAVELATNWINTNANWRTTIINDTETPQGVLGNGTFAWSLYDEDGNLADSDADSVLLKGIGRVGDTMQIESVLLNPTGVGLDCLGASLCIGDHADFAGVTVTGNQFISSNNTMWASSANINIPAKAVYSISGGTYNAGTQTGITARQMPDASSVFDYYLANGTFIDYSSLDSAPGSDRQINRTVLSPATNPFGSGQTNPSGIYVIDCGGNGFRCQFSRIVGTLVLLNVGPDSRFLNSVFLEPAIANFPSLLVQGDFRMDIDSSTPLDESLGRNFNPLGTPYQGQEDTDQTDTYPCMVKGLVYVSGNMQSNTNGSQAYDGVLVIGNYFNCQDPIDLQYQSTYLNNPPPGFSAGTLMQISPGSWQRSTL
jgi:hypothetical protein